MIQMHSYLNFYGQAKEGLTFINQFRWRVYRTDENE